MLTFGSKLPNGATVLQYAHRSDGASFVLCHWRKGNSPEDFGEYITWRLGFPEGARSCHFGRYFPGTPRGLAQATADLLSRAEVK